MKVSDDIENFKFNTAISAMMILMNQCEKTGLTEASYQAFLRLLAPFAPHLTEEIWHERGGKNSIHSEQFPVFDSELAKDEQVTIGVQINGKMRGTITITPDASEDTAMEAVQSNGDLNSRLAGQDIKKVIYISGKILNIISN